MKKIAVCRKILALLPVLALLGPARVMALDIKAEPPTFKVDPDYIAASYLTPYIDQLNSQVSSIFDEAKKGVDSQVKNINTTPKDFIGSWANSSVFASHGATQRGYQGYKLFNVSFGAMIGLQSPFDLIALASNPQEIMDEMSNLTEDLKKNGDLKLGLNPQIINAQISLNTTPIFNIFKFKPLPNDLYLGFRLGLINLDGATLGFEGAKFNTFNIGLTGNYQFFKPVSLAAGVLLWRGLSFGTGFLYQRTGLGYEASLNPITQDQDIDLGIGDVGKGTLKVKIDPSLYFDYTINTFTIPLEATTAVRLLWIFNLTLGAGVDIGFGSSDLGLGMAADITLSGLKGLIQDQPGSVSVSAGGDQGPSIFNPKLLAGLGLSMGPVYLDIPLAFYLDKGYSLGLTLGAVW